MITWRLKSARKHHLNAVQHAFGKEPGAFASDLTDYQAGEWIAAHFSLCGRVSRKSTSTVEDHPIDPEIRERPVAVLGLSVRALNCLTNEQKIVTRSHIGGYISYGDSIRTVGELVQHASSSLMKRKNLGRKTLLEIEKALARNGLWLASSGVKCKTCSRMVKMQTDLGDKP